MWDVSLNKKQIVAHIKSIKRNKSKMLKQWTNIV